MIRSCFRCCYINEPVILVTVFVTRWKSAPIGRTLVCNFSCRKSRFISQTDGASHGVHDQNTTVSQFPNDFLKNNTYKRHYHNSPCSYLYLLPVFPNVWLPLVIPSAHGHNVKAISCRPRSCKQVYAFPNFSSTNEQKVWTLRGHPRVGRSPPCGAVAPALDKGDLLDIN